MSFGDIDINNPINHFSLSLSIPSFAENSTVKSDETMLKVQKCIENLFKSPDYVKCYLCHEKVKEKHWISGSHRFQCVKKNKTRFESFLEHPDLSCIKCCRKLRLWTDQGTLFVCNSNLASCKSDGTTKEHSQGNRYSCFYCDFDLCLDCKNVWEERNNSRRAKAEKRLRNRVGKIDVTHVVCLKTLCDKVAQIEHSKKLRLKLKKCVSVGINTESASSTENDSSESATIVPATSEHETLDLTPTDPETNNILNEIIESDLNQDEEGNISRNSHFHKVEELQVEVHIPNGNISKSELNLLNIDTMAINGIDSSEDDRDSDEDNYDKDKDNNHNYKQPLLLDRDVRNPSPRHHRSNSCSCTMACNMSVTSRKSRSRLHHGRGESLLSMSESPDIFHLRAPLVSMENFVSSSVSSDSSLAEF